MVAYIHSSLADLPTLGRTVILRCCLGLLNDTRDIRRARRVCEYQVSCFFNPWPQPLLRICAFPIRHPTHHPLAALERTSPPTGRQTQALSSSPFAPANDLHGYLFAVHNQRWLRTSQTVCICVCARVYVRGRYMIPTYESCTS